MKVRAFKETEMGTGRGGQNVGVPGWDQEVAGALGSGAAKQRRLYFQKIALLQEVANGSNQLVPEP